MHRLYAPRKRRRCERVAPTLSSGTQAVKAYCRIYKYIFGGCIIIAVTALYILQVPNCTGRNRTHYTQACAHLPRTYTCRFTSQNVTINYRCVFTLRRYIKVAGAQGASCSVHPLPRYLLVYCLACFLLAVGLCSAAC